jgi:hypothetical protein
VKAPILASNWRSMDTTFWVAAGISCGSEKFLISKKKKQTRHCSSLAIPPLQHSVYVVTKHLACLLKDLLKGVLESWLVAFTPCDQGHTSAVNLALEYIFLQII